MEYILYIGVIILMCLCVAAYDYFDNYRENVKEEIIAEYVRNKQQKPMNTRRLLFETLWNLRANPKADENGWIEFEYQECRFMADARENTKCITVYLTGFYEIPLEDIDMLATMQRVVNARNHDMHGTCTMLYSIYRENGYALVHGCHHFLFINDDPDREGYLTFVLGNMLNTARSVCNEIEKNTVHSI